VTPTTDDALLCKNLLERNINNREIHTCFLKLNVKINVYIGTFSKGVSLQEMAFRQGVWLLAFLKATSQRKTGLGYLPPPSLSLREGEGSTKKTYNKERG